MSWIKTVSFSGQDVFDENADELNLQSKEWAANMKKRVMDGYVDGVDAGEEASLQAGFNQGFREGAAQTAALGRLKGMVSAIWCWCQIQHPENPPPVSVTDLLQLVTQHEDQIMESIRKRLENPPLSVSDVSDSMEDLEVEQAGPSSCGEKEPECCRSIQKMALGGPHQLQNICSKSTDCSGESLNVLLQRCMDVISELGLPQELIVHIQELKSV
uniref:Family with sequence similarity 105, member B, a n=1 Tax=Nothobranchius kuhntae TaxID=321403 RepID=A0A1A8JPW3_NOTKU